jgi:hypothetical protein
MLSAGIHNPRRNLAIALGVTLLAWASIAWGILEMQANGWEETTASGLKIGLAMLPALFGPFMILNFWWAVRIVAALKHGKKVLGRWQVSGGTLSTFLTQDADRSNHGPTYLNDWKAPSAPPVDGIEVIFGTNGVLVQDSYFALGTSGPYKFTAVGILPAYPLSIEFVTVATFVSSISAVTIRRFPAVLRLPITGADCPDALRVLDHYRKVLAGEIDPNPGFYQRRIRIGLIGAAIFGTIAVTGFVIGPQSPDYFDLPSLMMIFGSIFTFASLLLATLAWILSRRQRSTGQNT